MQNVFRKTAKHDSKKTSSASSPSETVLVRHIHRCVPTAPGRRQLPVLWSGWFKKKNKSRNLALIAGRK